MDKGICLFIGFNGDIKTRVLKMKEVGFTHIMTSADKRFNKQNGTLKSQVKLFKEVGLKLSSLHSSYNKEELPEFFKDSKIGHKIEKQLIKEVKIAKKYGFKCLVVHIKGEGSLVGLERTKRILKVCEKFNMPIAIENLRAEKGFYYLMENIDHPYLKMCYDVGHNNVFEKDVNLVQKFKDKIICFHLHDNDGLADQHTLNELGSIDWKQKAKDFKLIKQIPSLDYEILMYHKPNNITEDYVITQTYKNACELEELINKA